MTGGLIRPMGIAMTALAVNQRQSRTRFILFAKGAAPRQSAS
jgi:hypothetical protein